MRLRRVLLALAVAAGTLVAAEAIATLSESPPKYRLSELTGYELVPGWHNTRAARPESIDADGLRGELRAEILRHPEVPVLNWYVHVHRAARDAAPALGAHATA
jgi:hypothetical protein